MRSQVTARLGGEPVRHPETENGSASPMVAQRRTASILSRSLTQRHPSVRDQVAAARHACCSTHICRFAWRLHFTRCRLYICLPAAGVTVQSSLNGFARRPPAKAPAQPKPAAKPKAAATVEQGSGNEEDAAKLSPQPAVRGRGTPRRVSAVNASRRLVVSASSDDEGGADSGQSDEEEEEEDGSSFSGGSAEVA